MFIDFFSVFDLSVCQYLFAGLGVLGLFLCVKRLLMGGGAF